MIYLDYNATAPLRPQVRQAMAACYETPYNPSSVHAAGRAAKRLLEEAREGIAQHIGCFAHEIIFTASGTEANNMALRGCGERPLLVGATEHSSVRVCAERLGGDVLPVGSQGLPDLDILEARLRALGRPALVSVMLANNETGVVHPVRELAALAHRYDALVHCDAVQMCGKGAVDMGLLGVDLLTVSAHKMGGPIGAAALAVRGDLALKPLLYGGNQELGRRAGTENIAAISGFAKALELAAQDDWMAEVQAGFEALKARLRRHVPSVIVAGDQAPRLGHVLCLMTPGIRSETQLMHLDLAGICVSAGSACSSGRIAPSHVLMAMGYSEAVAGTALRVSAGWNTQPEELERFGDSWLEMAQRVKKNVA